MEQLSPRILVLIIVWALVAVALYVGSRRFPEFRYEELLRRPPLSDPPPRRWYHSIPLPLLWIALGVAGLTIAGIAYMRNHPSVFLQFLQSLSMVQLWTNDVDTSSVFIAPYSRIWASILFYGAFQLFASLSNLFATEVTASLFPEYLEYKFGNILGRMRIPFDKDWKSKEGKQKNRAEEYGAFIMIALMLVGYIGGKVEHDVTTYTALASLLIAFVYAVRLRLPKINARTIEIRKRFDSNKLTLLQRKRIWRLGLRGWVLIPLGIFWLGHIIPFYTFDESGISEHRRREVKLIPWDQIESLDIALREALPDTSSDKKPHLPHPRLEIILQAQDKKIDLNDMGALSLDPLLTRRIIELIRQRNIHVSCALVPAAQQQLKNFLASSTTSGTNPYNETRTFIEELCQSKL